MPPIPVINTRITPVQRLFLQAMESLGMFLRTPRRIVSLLAWGVPALGKAALAQSLPPLSLAIERQISESACAIVMAPDGKSFANGRPCPVLIAPSLPSELHPEIVGALGKMFNPGDISDSENVVDDQSQVTTLLGILWAF